MKTVFRYDLGLFLKTQAKWENVYILIPVQTKSWKTGQCWHMVYGTKIQNGGSSSAGSGFLRFSLAQVWLFYNLN